MNNMDNLHSYDNVEFVQGHELSDEELLGYCNHKMESARGNVEFIEREVLKGGIQLMYAKLAEETGNFYIA